MKNKTRACMMPALLISILLTLLIISGCAAAKSTPPPPVIPQEPKPILVDNATHVTLTVTPGPDKSDGDKPSGFQKLVDHIRSIVEDILSGKGP